MVLRAVHEHTDENGHTRAWEMMRLPLEVMWEARQPTTGFCSSLLSGLESGTFIASALTCCVWHLSPAVMQVAG